MKASNEAVVRFLAFASILMFFASFFITTAQFFVCFGAADKLPVNKLFAIMKVVVYGSTYSSGMNTVSARISLLDTDNVEFAVIERSWKGDSLSIDFVSAEFSGRTVYFPYAVRGRKKKEGTRLEPYYMDRGECLFAASDVQEDIRAGLRRLAKYALGQAKRIYTKFTRSRSLDLSMCATGFYYTVYSDFAGNLFIASD